MVRVIAITGGIGTGKSSLAGFLKELGYPIIQADKLAHEAINYPSSIQKLKDYFGADIVDANGLISKEKLRGYIFDNQTNKNFVEHLVHPKVQELFLDFISKVSKICNDIWVFYEIPLLFETQKEHEFETILLITASLETRIQRLIKTRNLKREDIEKIVATQMEDAQKIPKAHYVINNDGTNLDFEQSCWEMLKFLRKKFH